MSACKNILTGAFEDACRGDKEDTDMFSYRLAKQLYHILPDDTVQNIKDSYTGNYL